MEKRHKKIQEDYFGGSQISFGFKFAWKGDSICNVEDVGKNTWGGGGESVF